MKQVKMLICVACSNERTPRTMNDGNNRQRRLFRMLSENIKSIRKSKGLSQEELAIKLNVVRQTISKWEHGGSLR